MSLTDGEVEFVARATSESEHSFEELCEAMERMKKNAREYIQRVENRMDGPVSMQFEQLNEASE